MAEAEKKTVKKVVKKAAEKVAKATEKKAAPAKKAAAVKKAAPVKKADKKAEVIIQSPLGGIITPEEILKRVGKVDRVYIGISTKRGTTFRRLSLSKMRSREYIRIVSASNAFDMILKAKI